MKLAVKLTLFYYGLRINTLALFSKERAARKALTLFSTPRKRTIITHSPLVQQAHTAMLPCGGLRLKVYQWNAGAAKKILIVHGFESTALNFEHFILPLIKKEYTVIGFDAQAHGKSEGITITLPDFVANIEAVFRQYGPFDAYITHSFGGLATMHFCEKLVMDKPAKIVLIAPATESVSAINRFFRMLQLNKNIRNEFDRLVTQKAGVAASALSIRRAMQVIQSPVIWFHDKEDTITPFADAEEVQKDQRPNLQFVVTTGLGHRRIYRNPDVVQQVIQFV